MAASAITTTASRASAWVYPEHRRIAVIALAELDEFLGRKLECKVIELNRSRNNVVLSRRAVIEDADIEAWRARFGAASE